MDQEMFTYWNMNGFENLLTQLQQRPEIIKIDLPGRKKNRNERPYYTFFGKDGIDSIINWLEHRSKYIKDGKLPQDSTFIFCNQHGDPITKHALAQYWNRHLRKLGLIKVAKGKGPGAKTGKGLHEMRDVWRSLWSKSSASHIVGEYFMGHKIDSLGYDKSFRDIEFYQGEYQKAMPFFDLVSSGSAFGQVSRSEIEELLRNKTLEQNGRIKELEDEVVQLKQSKRVQALEDSIEKMQREQEKIMKLLYEHLPREKNKIKKGMVDE